MSEPEKVRPGRECKCGEDRRAEMVGRASAVDGHIAQCRSCKSAADRAYYAANSDRVRARVRDYRRANAESVSERHRAWAVANPEKMRAYRRAWEAANGDKIRAYREANAERIRESQREYRERNSDALRAYHRAYAESHADRARERARAWEAANPDRARAHSRDTQRRRRARKLGSPCASATVDEIQAMTEESGNYTCAACWGPAEHLDHIIPLSRGGCDGVHNFQWLCADCNRSKSARLMHEWRPEWFAKPDAA